MSSDPADLFADLLQPGETVLSSMAAPGPPRPNGARVWVQLGLTPQRLLAVVLVQAPHGGPWQPVARHAAPQDQVRIARFPRTPSSAARLELTGLPEPLRLLDIDDPKVFPWLEPFLAAWGRPVDGAGVVQQRQPQAQVATTSQPDTRLLLAAAGGLLALVALCCGCSGLISLLGTM